MVATLATLRTGDPVHDLLGRAIDLVQHESVALDLRALAVTQRLDDGLDAAAIGRVVLPEMQDAKRAHCEAAIRRGTARRCGIKSR